DGIPKILTSPEPFEIVTIPGRVLMFFEKDHGWRQIWTDGRKLPADPPELRFDGYSVGRWEGDTFIVESSGFNDKLWLDYYGARRRRRRRHRRRGRLFPVARARELARARDARRRADGAGSADRHAGRAGHAGDAGRVPERARPARGRGREVQGRGRRVSVDR